MRTSRSGDSTETGQAVTDDLARRIKAPLGKSRQGAIAEAGNPVQLQAHRLALGRGLDSGDERRLAGGTTAALAAGAFTPEIGIIQFHPPGQPFAGVALHHHLPQLVLDFPGRGLRHAEATANPMLDMPCLLRVRWYMARNHTRSGRWVEAKIVAAIGEVWRRQALHWNSPRVATSLYVRPPQTGHSKPFGQHDAITSARHFCSVP
jgi:hypothetical protein